jgi:hypothetical protein
MTERPKRIAVTNREPTNTLLDLQKHKSSVQVQQEKKAAASAAATAKAEKASIAAQKKKRVVAFEDQLRREDQQREKKMARPDLPHRVVCATSYFNPT